MKRLYLAAFWLLLAASQGLAKITLTSGNIQSPAGLVVPNGSMELQLNTDATIIASPGGQVMSSIPVLLNFDNTGNLDTGSQIWSNAELNPQNNQGLGTWYYVSFFDANGSKINRSPFIWQFPQAAGSTVPITSMVAQAASTIYYPFNSFINPMTTEGDMIYQHSGAAARLARGTNGQCLTSNGTDPLWASCSGGGTSVELQTNTVDNSSQTLLNILDSSADAVGLHLAWFNVSGGIVQGEITGPVNATEVNGLAVPASATIVGTNSSRQIIDQSAATLSNNTTGHAATITGLLDVTNTPLTTSQDLFYRNGSVLARLPISTVTSGQCLGNNSGTWGTFVCSGGSGSGINITVNAGSNLTGPANFRNGTSGNVIDFANPSASNVEATIHTASVTNAMLVNPATTVAGKTCTLGSSCTLASGDLSNNGSVSPTTFLGTPNSTITINGQSCVLASTCGIPFSTNGSGLSDIIGLDFINSTVNANGMIATFSNPTTHKVKVEITGTPAVAGGVTGFTFPTPAGSARVPQVIANGTSAMPTGSFANGSTCGDTTATATGALPTDEVLVSFTTGGGAAVNIFTIAGYNPHSASGMLTVNKWADTNLFTIEVCNPALNPTGSISPGAVNVNWAVIRP